MNALQKKDEKDMTKFQQLSMIFLNCLGQNTIINEKMYHFPGIIVSEMKLIATLFHFKSNIMEQESIKMPFKGTERTNFPLYFTGVKSLKIWFRKSTNSYFKFVW